MTREQALIRARGIWAEAGKKGTRAPIVVTRSREPQMRYQIVQPDWMGHKVVGWGTSWGEAVERYERRARGVSIALLEEEILALQEGDVLDSLRARLPELLDAVRAKVRGA